MLIGYCRTSTADQNPDHQIDALLRHGVDRDNIHVDVASGAKASRPKLDGPSTLIVDTSTLDLESRERSPRWGPTSTRRSSGPTRWRWPVRRAGLSHASPPSSA
ncbi:recombinase family protein [Streptomyces sp. NPDC051917]|uniref:recombinase family protein n=1 Tax=Streptomyces sp. NPDC051917 TaxID=3154754 RepID=UPI00345391BE